MNGAVVVVVERDRVVELRGTAPMAVRARTGDAGPEVWLVGSAASLLEGDRLSITVRVGDGSRLTVCSAAAQLAHPCPGGGRTEVTIDVDVAAGARLDWRPEPTVVCGGGDHRATATVRLAADAGVRWLDEVVLGRSGEAPASAGFTSELHVDVDAWPLLRDGLDTRAPGAHGPAVLGANRYVGAWHEWGASVDLGGGSAGEPGASDGVPRRFALAGPGCVHRVLATDVAAGRAALDTSRRSSASVPDAPVLSAVGRLGRTGRTGR